MDLKTFINTYFYGWTIAGVTSCGTSHGFLKLQSNGVFIKVFFRLNGDLHWAGPNVRAARVTAANPFEA